MKKIALVAIFPLLLGMTALAEQKSSDLKFLVLKDESGKPVRNAAVVLHQVDKDGHESKGGMELKTDHEGRAGFPGAPYGKLRVQVLARGFQTFGQDYDVNQPTHEFVIKLKRPQHQYSIYEDKPKK